ncbi:glycerol-3-phosphate responsive antiterminator GlpP, partial [Staphylococcus saprophyticus]
MKPYILPAIRSMKDLEKMTQTDYKECVLLDTHIGHIKSIMDLLNKHHIETYMHIDLIKG